MFNDVTAYVIYDITKKQYILRRNNNNGRKIMIYGDLASAKRMLKELNDKKRGEFANDRLRIVELKPKFKDWEVDD